MAEAMPLHPYLIFEERKSEIDPHRMLEKEVGISCPRCKQQIMFDHKWKVNRSVTCSICALEMHRLSRNAARCVTHEKTAYDKFFGALTVRMDELTGEITIYDTNDHPWITVYLDMPTILKGLHTQIEGKLIGEPK